MPCGEYPDAIENGEKAIADRGYRDQRYFITPENIPLYPRIKKILARHETVNGRLKQFKILQIRFRNKLHLHPKCFHAVVNLVQISINHGNPLFQI